MPRVVSIKVERLKPEEINQNKKAAVPKEPKGDVKPRIKQELITDHLKIEKKRKSFDRFNGTSKEELMTRVLPDRLKENLDIVFIGINPGLFAAYKQHYYAGPGNHFWKCLFLSGLVPEPMTSDEDESINDYGIGFTNMVARTTPGSNDLTRTEIKEGSKILLEKMQRYKPRIIVFNGKGIYEVFNSCFGDKNKNFPIGKQSHFFPGTESYIYVVPSSSARCAQLPRAIDKVPFYAALKKFRDYLKGDLDNLDENEVMFPDLEMVAAPVEPEARAIFIEEKRVRDEEKKAERLRIKIEKKVKAEVAEGGEEAAGVSQEEGVVEGAAAAAAGAAGNKRTSKSPAINGDIVTTGAKQRKSPQPRQTKRQKQQQQQQNVPPEPPVVKLEKPDEYVLPEPPIVPSAQRETSPHFPPPSISPSTPSNNGIVPQQHDQTTAQFQGISQRDQTSQFHDISHQETPFTSAPCHRGVATAATTFAGAAGTAPNFPSTTHSSCSSLDPFTTTTTASTTSSLTQMTPSLKREDPHLLSALQFLNQNEMLNPQQMSEQFSQYSHYFTQNSQR